MQALVLACIVLGAQGKSDNAGSPVQKVIELLQANKVKVQQDLDAEAKEMMAYSEFCDTETSEKNYALKTATRKIADLNAAILNGNSQVAGLTDEVSTLGTEMAEKERKLLEANAARKSGNAEFQATEKALVESVDQLDRAIVMLKRGSSFVQAGAKGNKDIKLALSAISKILDASWVSTKSKKALKGFMQTQQGEGEDSDLELNQPQAKVSAYESKSGGIVEQVQDMKEKAEETLSGLRNAEMKEAHNHNMMDQSLTDAMNNIKDKLSNAKSSIATLTEENGKAKGELEETSKTKKSDSLYLGTLTSECTETRENWAGRQASAKEEMDVIEKAKSILSDRVNVFVQVGKSAAKHDDDEDGEDSKTTAMRQRVVQKLKDLSHTFSSYALMEMVSVASADPFEKVRGLVEEMIAKLVNEANEEATQKAFCDEEISKSKKSQQEKSMTSDKLTSRIDKAASTKAELEQGVKDLQAEIAELDAGTSKATQIRSDEHATYVKSSADFKQAAEAVAAAIGVLKEYYEGALVQVSSSKAPSFGGAKGDAASSIISILEMSEENFTKMYMQVETEEGEAQRGYDKLAQENKVSKAAKEAEAKAAASEVKSLEVALKNNNEDLGMTSKELDAVMSYLEKLKPQCETKAMSYAEKKARREAEIDGLKEALQILDGSVPALVQVKNLRVARRI